MQKLTDSEYWDKTYSHANTGRRPEEQQRISRGLGAALKRISEADNYASHLFWDVICRKYLPAGPARILEVGCAPGGMVVRFAKTFGYEPYGVDFSKPGIDATKQLFVTNGFNPDNVIHADFCEEKFLADHRESFDVVVSIGFIEHFTEVEKVVDRHVQLLKEGGTLLISIPNLSGINFGLTYLINREALKIHNLALMKLKTFQGLFRRSDLENLFCGYYGVFHCGVCITSEKDKTIIGRFCGWLQVAVSYVLKRFPLFAKFENGFSSPYLLYIGKKKSRN